MNNRELARLLRENAQNLKVTYIANAVRAKVLKKKILESKKRGFLSEDVTPAATAPGMGTSRASTPSQKATMASAPKGYPDPESYNLELEDHFENGAKIPGTGSAAQLMGDGPGTYADLLFKYEQALAIANTSRDRALSMEDVAAFLENATRNPDAFSPEDIKRLRSLGARLLRRAPGSGKKAA